MQNPREVREWWQRYWGWMLIAVAIAMSVVYYNDVRDREAASRCQASFNSTFAQVVTLRAESSGARQAALDELIGKIGTVVASPPTTAKQQRAQAAEYRALFKRYAEVVAEADQVRSENPYPAFPQCRIG